MQYTAGPPGLSCVQYTAGPSGLSCVQYTAGPPGLGPAVYCRPRAVCFTGGGVYGAAPVSRWVSAPFLPWVRVLVLCPASSPPCTRVLLRPFPGLRIPASLLCRLLSELPREWGIGLPGPTGSADPAPALGPRAARLRPSAEKLGCTGWGKRGPSLPQTGAEAGRCGPLGLECEGSSSILEHRLGKHAPSSHFIS